MYFIRCCWFLKCPEEGLLVGGEGVLLVHSEIYYVPVGDGWEEVLVRNVQYYITYQYFSPTQLWVVCASQLTAREGSNLKGLVAVTTLFIYFFFYSHINSYLHFFIAFAQQENLPGVSSRDLNWGLPYSRPAHYQLSYAALYTNWAMLHPNLM